MKTQFDSIIIGGGIVGQVTALALSDLGLSTAIVDARDLSKIPANGRAYALAASTVRMLTRLSVDIKDMSQPMMDMLVTEGRDGTPWKMHFDSRDHGQPTAHMIESAGLNRACWDAVQKADSITVIDQAAVTAWQFELGEACAALSSGQTLSAPLMVAADGRNSPTRRAAKITVQTKAYDQSALVTTISHSLPHDGLALQRFLAGGPLAVLPLTDQRSQIVWSDKTIAIDAALALPDASFIDLLAERVGDHLGELSLAAPRQSYPLSLQTADRFTAQRLALVGDAAHVIHPLAGQGLNLGLRDVAALADGVSEAMHNGQDIGVAGLLGYETWRRSDVDVMSLATDGLSRLFRAKSKTVGHVRRAGLALIDGNDLAKSFFMSEAAGDLGDLPHLMRR